MFDKLRKLFYKHNSGLVRKDYHMPEEKQMESEDVPTLKPVLETEGTTFRLTELRVNILTLGAEIGQIKIEERKLQRRFRKSQSKIISKYVDKTFVDPYIPLPEPCEGDEKETLQRLQKYENLCMRARYSKAKKIAREKHPEAFAVDEGKLEKYLVNLDKLRQHRKGNGNTGLKNEARLNLLAYGFIKGKQYHQIEANPHWQRKPFSRPEPDFDRVVEIVRQFTNIPGNKQTIKTKLSQEMNSWKGN